MTTLHERVVERHGHRYIKLKSGRLVGFHEVLDATRRAHTDLGRGVSRAFKLAVAREDPVLRDYDLDQIDSFLDRLEEHVYAMQHYMEKLRGVRKEEERIAALRTTTGHTPEEAAVYLRKADALEAALRDT